MLSLETLEPIGVSLLALLDANPTREGLKDTPKRWAKALISLTEGVRENPCELLKTQFTDSYDQIVAMTDIPFYSLCEHHMLPFFGSVSVAYLPGKKKVFGASKLVRLVDCFSRRLQIQERMTDQIATALMDGGARGAAVVASARHLCMEMRGVRKSGMVFNTTAALGEMRDDPTIKREWETMLMRGTPKHV